MKPTRPPSLVDELHDLQRRIAVLERRDAVRNVPGKLLATIELGTTTVSGITSDQAPITGWTGDVVLASGRRYRVDLVAHVTATSTGGNFGVNTMDDGVRVQFARGHAEAGSSQYMTVSSVCYLDGDGATHTIRADFDVIDAGTYSVASNASTNPCLMMITDIGPTP